MSYKNFPHVYPREKYLSKIRPFYSSDVIKIITGIRRCGKSFTLRAVINELLANGVDEQNIIYLPLDKRGFKYIETPQQLEEKIEEYVKDEASYYLFIDEVQNVSGFEKVVQSYQEEGFSIFLTGSNSYLLSDEISTKLTGRYVSFEIFTLDFSEYLEMKKFHNMTIDSDVYRELDEYILNGGFPKSLEFDDVGARNRYTTQIIDEIFTKDVRKRQTVRNLTLYERIQSYLINNFTSPFSLQNIMEYLERSGIKAKTMTVRNYIEYLQKAKIVYECNRFDLKSKQSLTREQKYYLADLSLYYAVNTDARLSYGPSLENLVYLYLVSHDYKVSVGKIGNLECDFIARNTHNEYAYIQVTYSMQGEDREKTKKIQEREYRPFRKISDGYPRYIISLDRYGDQREGVIHINALDLFLGKETIGRVKPSNLPRKIEFEKWLNEMSEYAAEVGMTEKDIAQAIADVRAKKRARE